jgi:hypothetical protein
LTYLQATILLSALATGRCSGSSRLLQAELHVGFVEPAFSPRMGLLCVDRLLLVLAAC